MISRFIIPNLVLILLAICSSQSHPLSKPSSVPRSSVALRSEPTLCAGTGNADLYGLGIRLGMYLQTLSTMLAETFVRKMALDFRDVNGIFLLALLIAIFKATIQNELTVVDGIVMLRILWCFVICAMSKGIWPLVKALQKFGSKQNLQPLHLDPRIYLFEQTTFGEVFSLYFRVWVSGVIAIANVYFWYHGVDKVRTSNVCPSFLFYFARLDAFGGVRIFYKVTSVFLTIFYGYLSLFPWAIIFGIALFLVLLPVALAISVVVVALCVILIACSHLIFTAFTSSEKQKLPSKEKERPETDLFNKDESLGTVEKYGLSRINTLDRAQSSLHKAQSSFVDKILLFIFTVQTWLRKISDLMKETSEPADPPEEEGVTSEPAHSPKEEGMTAKPVNSPKEEGATAEPADLPEEEEVAAEPADSLKKEGATAEPVDSPKEEGETVEPAAPKEEGVTAETANLPNKEVVTSQPVSSPKEEGETVEPAAPKEGVTAETANLPNKEVVTSQPVGSPTEEGATSKPTDPSKEERLPLLFFAVCLLYWVWSIIGIEQTLKWNSATEVYGLGLTAQLVPFVIGVASFVQVLWRTAVKIDEVTYVYLKKRTKRLNAGSSYLISRDSGARNP